MKGNGGGVAAKKVDGDGNESAIPPPADIASASAEAAKDLASAVIGEDEVEEDSAEPSLGVKPSVVAATRSDVDSDPPPAGMPSPPAPSPPPLTPSRPPAEAAAADGDDESGPSLDDSVDIPLPLPPASRPPPLPGANESGFVPQRRGDSGGRPPTLPGAYNIPGMTSAPAQDPPARDEGDDVFRDEDSDYDDHAAEAGTATATMTDMTSIATATLVQDGTVVEATEVDVEAEAAERERLRAEIAALRAFSSRDVGGGDKRNGHGGGCVSSLEEKGRRCGGAVRRRRNMALAAVGAAALAACVAGAVLGSRQKERGDQVASGGGDKQQVSPTPEEARTPAQARLEAIKSIVLFIPMYGWKQGDALDFFDDNDEANKPRLEALRWVAHDDPAQLDATTFNAKNIRARYVLALLYFSAGGEGWTRGCDFLSGSDICEWVDWFGVTPGDSVMNGVVCDEGGRVTELNLWWNNLSGTIPPELSFFAPSLNKLDFNGGALSSTIPSELGSLTALEYLGLNENCLSGSVPESLFGLTNLKVIDTVGNKDLTGNLNGFCDGTEYKGSLFHVAAHCDSCPGSPALIECDCCVCCDIVSYTCCDLQGNEVWNIANLHLNPAGHPYSYDRPCLSDETVAYYVNNHNDTSWMTAGRGDGS